MGAQGDLGGDQRRARRPRLPLLTEEQKEDSLAAVGLVALITWFALMIWLITELA
jgi:hypothetical protein